MTLLKGLPLYRAILREHRRSLPPHLKQLGDQYVKSEFRLHRAAKSDILLSFNEEWNAYLSHLRVPASKIGAYMQEEEMQKLAPHQQEQLAKLKDEAIKAARAAEGDGGEGGGQGGWGGRDPFPSKLG